LKKNKRYNDKFENNISNLNIEIQNEIETFILWENKQISDDQIYAINKTSLNNWKSLVNYKYHKNYFSLYKTIRKESFSNDKKSIGKINNKDLFFDLQSFLNDGEQE